MAKKMFLYCEKCNKKLIERLPNGLFKFIFGSDKNKKGNPPVQLFVFGSVKIRCFRKTITEEREVQECGQWNIFNFFPSDKFINQPEEKSIKEEILAKDSKVKEVI